MERTDESELWCIRRQLDRLAKARLQQPFSQRDREEYDALSHQEAELLGLTLRPTG